MAFVEYVSRRNLAPFHVAETPYVLVLPGLTRCDLGRERKSFRKVSLSGAVETGFYYSKRTWSVQTEPVPMDEARLILEFLGSVDDGQSFTFDPYGLPDRRSADAAVVVTDDQGFTQDRFIKRGAGGADDYFQFSFGVREL